MKLERGMLPDPVFDEFERIRNSGKDCLYLMPKYRVCIEAKGDKMFLRELTGGPLCPLPPDSIDGLEKLRETITPIKATTE